MFYKGYKIRLLPTPEQEKLFYLKSDATRFVWNWALGYQMKRFENQEKLLSKFDLMKELRQLKNTDDNFRWIELAGAFIINQIILDLNNAYQSFFSYRKSGGLKYSKHCKIFDVYHLIKHPKFKSKKNSKIKFPVRYDRTTFYTKENCLSNIMQKYIGTVSVEGCSTIKYQTNYDVNRFNGKIKNARISLVNNKWILSFTVETDENQVSLNDYSCGIDVGVKNLATVSCNNEVKVYKNINKTASMKKKQKKLKRLNRQLSKCQKDSKRRQKAKNKYSAYSKYLSNIRQNYIHNCSADIIKKLPEKIVVETISELSWMKNKQHNINREVQFSGVFEFLRQLEYKSQNSGIKFVKADKYYPSTQLCSYCGNKKKLNLNERIYHCDVCGLEIDRDINAAINLEHYNYK
jgi:putative transposase